MRETRALRLARTCNSDLTILRNPACVILIPILHEPADDASADVAVQTAYLFALATKERRVGSGSVAAHMTVERCVQSEN